MSRGVHTVARFAGIPQWTSYGSMEWTEAAKEHCRQHGSKEAWEGKRVVEVCDMLDPTKIAASFEMVQEIRYEIDNQRQDE